MTDDAHSHPSAADAMSRLIEIMAKLRDTGCAWDVAQDFSTIAPYTIEEAYEVADAIQREDMNELKEELGDLLFQVVFHSQMAKEVGAFEIADVVDAINAKMIRRHPHVFGNEDNRSPRGKLSRLRNVLARTRATVHPARLTVLPWLCRHSCAQRSSRSGRRGSVLIGPKLPPSSTSSLRKPTKSGRQ